MKIIHIMQILLVCIFMPSLAMKRDLRNSRNHAELSEVIVVPEGKQIDFKQQFEKNRSALSCFSLELSLQQMNKLFHQLPDQEKKCVAQKMSSASVFCIASQHIDMRHEIITKMIGTDDPIAIELFDNEPMERVFHHYEKVKKYNDLGFGNRKYMIGRLFRLSLEGGAETTDWLIALNHSPFTRLQGKSYKLVDQYDSKEKIPAMPVDMRKNLSVQVISPNYMQGCRCYSGGLLTISLILCCWGGCIPAAEFCCCAGGWCCCIHHCIVEKNSIEVNF